MLTAVWALTHTAVFLFAPYYIIYVFSDLLFYINVLKYNCVVRLVSAF